MNRYLINIMLLLMVMCTLPATAQENRDITFTGYPGFEVSKGQTAGTYLKFDTLSRIAERYPAELNGTMYQFYILFKIDTLCKVVDFKLVEISICRIPQFIKECIKGLMHSTSGQWTPEIKNGRKTISDELIWQVVVMQKKQPIEERLKEYERFTPFRKNYQPEEIERRFDLKKFRTIHMMY